MITIVQRAKVIGVCTAVNLLFELVGTLYITLSGWLLWMTQVRFNITLLNFISTSANIRAPPDANDSWELLLPRLN